MSERKPWTPTEVVDVSGPPALLRNYLEQRDVRRYLERAASAHPLRCAVDVGAGFGRLAPVLAEYAERVIGFEREGSLLATARRLLPSIEFIEVATLTALPASDASTDFVLSFTVLQHMPDEEAEAVMREIVRLARPRAHVLLCEETDSSLEAGDSARADLGYTRGRSVQWYSRRLESFTLQTTSPRAIEPGYPRPDVGTYMFFARG